MNTESPEAKKSIREGLGISPIIKEVISLLIGALSVIEKNNKDEDARGREVNHSAECLMASAALFLFLSCSGGEKVVPVTGIYLNKATLSLYVDAQETLNATIHPANATNKNLSWSSSNTSVATVDDSGYVMALGNGRATITVASDDGNKTASCKLTVVVSDEDWIALVDEKIKWMNNSFVEMVADWERDGNNQVAAGLAYLFAPFIQKSVAHIRAFRTAMARGDRNATKREREAIISFYREQINKFKTDARTMRSGNAALADLWNSIAGRLQRDLEAIQG